MTAKHPGMHRTFNLVVDGLHQVALLSAKNTNLMPLWTQTHQNRTVQSHLSSFRDSVTITSQVLLLGWQDLVWHPWSRGYQWFALPVVMHQKGYSGIQPTSPLLELLTATYTVCQLSGSNLETLSIRTARHTKAKSNKGIPTINRIYKCSRSCSKSKIV